MAEKNPAEGQPMTRETIVKSQANYEGNQHSDLVEIEIVKDGDFYKKGDKDVVHPSLAHILKEKGLIANLGKAYERPRFDQKDVNVDVQTMPFIDRSYFDGPLLLQVDTEATGEAVDAAIAYWQPDYLRRVLGPSLAAVFEYGIANPTGGGFSNAFSDAFDIGSLNPKWRWIRDGYVYTYGGRKHIWPGLTNEAKQSPLANWVYWHYRKDNETLTTGVGEVRMTTENSTIVASSHKLVRAWDQMVDWNRALWGLVSTLLDEDGARVYPELVPSEVDCSVFEYCFGF